MNAPKPPEGTKRAAARSRRRKWSPALIPGAQKTADLLMLTIAAMASHLLSAPSPDEMRIMPILYIIFVEFALMHHANLYAPSVIARPVKRLDDLVIGCFSSTMLVYGLIMGVEAGERISASWLILFMCLASAALVVGRLATSAILRRMARRGRIGHAVVVLGAGPQARRLLQRLRGTNPYFIEVIGAFRTSDADPVDALDGCPILGDSEDLVAYARKTGIDDVIVALPWSADREAAAAVERLKELPINVYLSSDLVGFELAFRPIVGSFHDVPLFEVVQRPISGWSSALKALEDYVIASVLVVLLAPLFALIAIAIKLDSRGPVFFMQPRLGFNNSEFRIYKFRSMHHDSAQSTAVVQARRRDSRVTRVGRVLRATSLDELPQLFNVLDGSMSLVGPRPHALNHNAEYGEKIRGYFARHKVKPGITGWAQVNGLRGETETLQKMEARIRHDVYYAENWSLAFDIRILVQTAFTFLLHRNAY